LAGPLPSKQFGKILIEGNYDSFLSHGQRQSVLSFAARRHGANPNNVMTGCRELGHGVARNILISEKRMSRGARICFF